MPTERVTAVLVEDHALTRVLMTSALSSMGINTLAAATAAEAMQLITEHDPRLLVSDLDLGLGPTGVELVAWAQQRDPTLGVIMLSAFRSTYLVDPLDLPTGPRRVLLVKEEIDSSGVLIQAVEYALGISDDAPATSKPGKFTISPDQADVLRLMSSGLSNAEIAAQRNTSVSAVENLLRRMYTTLGLAADDGVNPRSAAVALYRQSAISVS